MNHKSAGKVAGTLTGLGLAAAGFAAGGPVGALLAVGAASLFASNKAKHYERIENMSDAELSEYISRGGRV